MKKRLLIVTLIISTCFSAFSQSTTWNDYNKYWYYRYRLVTEFLVRGEETPFNCTQGPGSGYSMPAAYIYNENKNRDIGWADGTVDLGWYIGVLATEYKLLTLNGQPTEQTRQELYYAMKAYERLDRKAEKIFYPFNANADCSLNGFFVRDDVSEEFILGQTALTSRFLVDPNDPFTYNSDYIGQNGDYAYPSQDQIASLLMAFALVKKCLGNASYNGYNFADRAIEYTHLITSYLEGNDWEGKLEDGSHYDDWQTFKTEGTAYGVAKAAQKTTGVNYSSALVSGGAFPLQLSRWQELGNPGIGPGILDVAVFHNKIDFTAALIQSYAAVGSSWELGLIPVAKQKVVPVLFVCRSGIFFYPCIREVTIPCYTYELNLPGSPINLPVFGCFPQLPFSSLPITGKMLDFYGNRYGQQFFPLLHEYLHNQNSLLSSSVFTSRISDAPCEGPHRYDDNTGVAGWRADNRWTRSLVATNGINDLDPIPGNNATFNGLDYMLIYNLYLLTRGVGNVSYENLMRPASANNITSAGKYWAYESLELSGTVVNNSSTANAAVELTANKQIRLVTGFKVQAGAKAKIYISDQTACNTAEENSGSLRTNNTPLAAEQEQLEQKALQDITTAVQAKLDSIAAVYSARSAYTPVDEYLKNRQNQPAAKSKEPGIKETTETKISLYPNPTDSDDLYVELSLKESQQVKVTIRTIYDANEALLFDDFLKSGANRVKLDIKDFSKGIFIIQVRGKELNSVNRLIKR